MANGFKIVISATDKATSAIRNINNSMSKMGRPFANVQRSMRALTQEIRRNPAVKAFSGIARSAQNAAAGVSKLIAPMTAVLGVGSIAGITALAAGWGRLGIEVTNTSKMLGSSAGDLQALRGAAKLAGSSSEALDGSLESLRQTMQDAKWGRNSDVVALMSRLGIGFRTTSTGAIDAVRSLKDVADAIAAQPDIGAKHTVAKGFGIFPALLPFVMDGSRAMEDRIEQAKKLGLVMDGPALAAARRYGESILQLEGAMTGLRNTIASAIVPAFTPLLDKFGKLIAANRALVSLKIKEWTDKFANWVTSLTQADWDSTVAKIRSVGDAITAVANAINSSVEALKRFDKFNEPRIKALDDEARKYGPRMNLPGQSSSGMIKQAPGAVGAPGPGSSLAGAGRGAVPGNAGMDARSLGYNHPLLNSYATSVEKTNSLPPGLLNAIKNYGERSGSLAVSPKGARGVMQFMPDTWKKFGAGDPTDPYASIDAAGRYFKDMLGRYGGNVDAAITEYNGGAKQAKAVQGGGRPWVAETANYLSRVKAGMNGGDAQKMEITLTIPNAPAGTKATARTASGDVPVRINHSMNTLSAG